MTTGPQAAAGRGERPEIRRLRPGDAGALCRFYNELSPASKGTFRPLGVCTTLDTCRDIARDNGGKHQTRFDLVALHSGAIVGWAFLWNLDSDEPTFGLAVADDYQGRGLGASLAREVMDAAAHLGLARVVLTVVKDNHRARRLYERLSFSVYGEFVHEEDGLTYLRMAAAPGQCPP